MKKNAFFVLILLCCVCLGADEITQNDDTELKRIEEEMLQMMQDSFSPKPDHKTPEPIIINQKFPSPIAEIEVVGNTILSEQTINKWIKSKIGIIDDLASLNSATKELENLYIDDGYITTKVKLDSKNSSIRKSKMTFMVLEGKISKYTFNGEENAFKSMITFPKRRDNLANVRDFDQAIENLSNMADMQITSSKDAFSIIDLDMSAYKPLSLWLNYNNLGSRSIGKDRGKISAQSKDIFGLNETIFGYYQDELRQFKNKKAKSYYIFTNFPVQYWAFWYSYEYSDYKIAPSFGKAGVHNMGIANVLYRNKNRKLTAKTSLTLKKIDTYKSGVWLDEHSRKLSILSIYFPYMDTLFGGLINVSGGVHFGLNQFGANNDDEWYRDDTTPTAKFTKYTLYMNWYKPINLVYYRLNFGSQYTDDRLYPSEKLTISDDVSVKGYRMGGIIADRAFYLRNEIGLTTDFIKPFVGYDVGRGRNTYCASGSCSWLGDQIRSISAGTRLAYKNFDALINFSRATNHPERIKTNPYEFYISANLKF